MFINEDNREYQFYNVELIVTASQIVDTLIFTSRARESVQKELVIKNPLGFDAEFYIKCDKLEIPDILKISRNSEVNILWCIELIKKIFFNLYLSIQIAVLEIAYLQCRISKTLDFCKTRSLFRLYY